MASTANEYKWHRGGAIAVLPTVADAQSRCPGLRALDGKCANPEAIEDTQNRAMIMTTVRNSYFGTPIGTVGGQYIPFERLFRDRPELFGLPTYEFTVTGEGGPTGLGVHRTR
jgi:hypothetical protein